jgi:hypothetical protein
MDVELPTPTAPFSIGTSSTVDTSANPAALPVDMSLDEIINARRKADKGKKTGDNKKTPNRRASIKSKSVTPDNNNNNKNNQRRTREVQKSVGAGKAKRNAKIANRRGLASSNKANPVQIEREIYRQQRGGGGNNSNNFNGNDNGPRTRSATQPSRSIRSRNNNNNKNNVINEAARKIKAKNLEKKRNAKNNNNNSNNNNNNNGPVVKAPSKKVMNAAMAAMQSAGYTAPKGMKLVVSLAPSTGGGNAGGAKKQQQGKSNKGGNGGNGGRGRGRR